jgi:hypothetical protein
MNPDASSGRQLGMLPNLLLRGLGFKRSRVQVFIPAGGWPKVSAIHLNPQILDPLNP